MIRRFKILGLMLVAMLAVGVASTSAADFHSESVSTNIRGSQTTTNTLSIHSGSFHCSTATFAGTASSNTTSNMIVTPTYSGCKSTGFIEANMTVDTNGCDYNITDNGSVHLQTCNAGAPGIVFTLPFCTVVIKEGQTWNFASFSNNGSGATREVTMTTKITNIAYSESGFACANSGTNTTGGTYTGSILLTGSSAGAHRGIWWTA